MMSRRSLLLLACLLLTACSRRESAPADDGSPRLVVLSPAMSVMLRDLGKETLIVGRHAFDLILPKELPIAGDQHTLDYERIVTLHPTHILLEAGATDLPPRLTQLAEANRWNIVNLPMLTLDDVRAALTKLDEITDGPSEKGRSLRTAFDDALKTNADAASRLGKVLPLAWTDPPGVMGPRSFHAQLIEALGAVPIPKEGPAFIEWSVEDVVHADPDTLLILRPGSDESVETVLGPLAKLDLRCIREGRVIVIRDPLCHTPSTALTGVARSIAEEAMKHPALAP